MIESIKILIKLGYSKKESIDLVTRYPLCNYKDETLKNNIISVYDYLLSLGYTKKDVIKMTRLSPSLYSYSKENIQDKMNFLISLGYTKEDVIKMMRLLPSLYSLSKEYIQDKMNFLISLGYTKADVIKMTKLLPSLYGISKENIIEKTEYLKSVELEFIILYDPKMLMQSVKLTYARYKFLTEEKNIGISKESYKKLFISNKQFENAYGISKKELLERYPYEKIKTLYKIKKL